jgi:hypothetical protein
LEEKCTATWFEGSAPLSGFWGGKAETSVLLSEKPAYLGEVSDSIFEFYTIAPQT